MRSKVIAVAAAMLLLAGAAAGSAAAATGSASGQVSVLVPAPLKPHELCVKSNTTGTTCRDVPGALAVMLTVRFSATGNVTPPSASVGSCAAGAVVTVNSGGGTLSGSATVSGLWLAPQTVGIEPTTTPGETVTVSFCEKP